MSTGSGKTEVAMRGGGYYSLATAGARDVIDAATPLVLKAIDSLTPGSGPFTISDMGCADGGTSRRGLDPAQVEQYLAADDGKRKKLTGFFVGQIMKLSKGQANPKMVNELLAKKLV